jgi:hypothetical protein
VSNEDLILSKLSNIERELGTQSRILTDLDVAVRGSTDGKVPGLRADNAATKAEVGRAHERIDAVEERDPTVAQQRGALHEYGTPAASGGGMAALVYIVLQWFGKGGG